MTRPLDQLKAAASVFLFGYRPQPVEVTPAMRKAGRDAMYSGAWTSDEDEAEAIYRAMIAACESAQEAKP